MGALILAQLFKPLCWGIVRVGLCASSGAAFLLLSRSELKPLPMTKLMALS
jgi:hypothetical protein